MMMMVYMHDVQINVSSMPRTEQMEVTLPGSSVPARVGLTLPPVLRESEDYKFPLLVNM